MLRNIKYSVYLSTKKMDMTYEGFLGSQTCRSILFARIVQTCFQKSTPFEFRKKKRAKLESRTSVIVIQNSKWVRVIDARVGNRNGTVM